MSDEYNKKMGIAEWVVTRHERPSGKKTYHRWVGTSIFLKEGLLDVDLYEGDDNSNGVTAPMTPDEAEAFGYTLIAAARQMREKLGQDNE